MSVIIFIVVLAVLVLVHEFGHFIVAKKSGIKVTEFGVGFPPKVWSKERGETTYSINAIPFGGFVRIFGEDPNDDSLYGSESSRSITSKPRYIQAAVLVAGVVFNILFAWSLISIGYMVGLPTPVDYTGPGEVKDVNLIVTSVSVSSPAETSGIKAGDTILSATAEGKYELKDITPKGVSNFIEAHGREGITFGLSRGKEILSKEVVAKEGIIPDRVAVGITMDSIGELRLAPPQAIYEGLKSTVQFTKVTAVGLISFIKDAVMGKGDFSQVTGPVGIIGLVGDASRLGFIHLLLFTAVISINLAIINLFPFPALDGGRLLVLGIEALRRKPISPKTANALNGVGFAILILLMVVVTIHDIGRFLK